MREGVSLPDDYEQLNVWSLTMTYIEWTSTSISHNRNRRAKHELRLIVVVETAIINNRLNPITPDEAESLTRYTSRITVPYSSVLSRNRSLAAIKQADIRIFGELWDTKWKQYSPEEAFETAQDWEAQTGNVYRDQAEGVIDLYPPHPDKMVEMIVQNKVKGGLHKNVSQGRFEDTAVAIKDFKDVSGTDSFGPALTEMKRGFQLNFWLGQFTKHMTTNQIEHIRMESVHVRALKVVNPTKWWIIEEWTEGDETKFCGAMDAGIPSTALARQALAFLHWHFVQVEGTYCFADLAAMVTKQKATFFDPMVHHNSDDDVFQPNVLRSFLSQHQCNSLCVELDLSSPAYPYIPEPAQYTADRVGTEVVNADADTTPSSTEDSDVELVSGKDKASVQDEDEENPFKEKVVPTTVSITSGRMIRPNSKFVATPTPPRKKQNKKKKNKQNKNNQVTPVDK